jgi:hypothetical protein
MARPAFTISLILIFTIVTAEALFTTPIDGQSLQKEQMAAIYGGGEQPQPIVFDAKCVASTACNLQQSTCGQYLTQADCLGSGQNSVYSGNRDYCGPRLPGDALQDCQEGSPYTCAIVQQCTWQNGMCVILMGGAQNTIQVPSACTNVAQGP